MKRYKGVLARPEGMAVLAAVLGWVIIAGFAAPSRATRLEDRGEGSPTAARNQRPSATVVQAAGAKYTVLAWNDLGMHCINPRYEHIGILPPFNNVWVQVIRKGEEPKILRSGIRVFYSFAKNKTVAGKSDFWTHQGALFGTNLPEGIGLTGNGLAGEMKLVNTPYPHYEVTGVPILPFQDDGVWNPYQQATVVVKDSRSGKVLATAKVVVPVSDELNCQKCHYDGAMGLSAGSIEENILALHDRNEGTDLLAAQPVLCAKCHADAALGAAGTPGVKSLSEAMHHKHSTLDARITPGCQDCHPGEHSQCNRSAIPAMGPKSASDPNCEYCHGSLANVAQSVSLGRRPWLDEPGCGDCHRGKNMDTGAVLFRHATGHGGVACEACHNSPHAWYPSRLNLDNWQPLTYQNDPGPVGKKCTACHTRSMEKSHGPHAREDVTGGDD